MTTALNTPVAFLVFNRADTTAKVFAAIRKAKPKRLLVVADGPRTHVREDVQRCKEVRALIKPDWPCRVQRLYSEENLGCRDRVSSGLDWIFQQVPEAIILEDDCLPHSQFFKFTSQMLIRYRNAPKVMMICGSGFSETAHDAASYRFSNYPLVWGWASWRRAWRKYDVSVVAWPEFLSSGKLKQIFKEKPLARRYWEDYFELVFHKKIDTWDYQWTFALWNEGGITVLPWGNLITNVGAGPLATHTRKARGSTALFRPYRLLKFPLVHPRSIVPNDEADALLETRNFSGKSNIKSWLRTGRRRLLTLFANNP